MLRDPRARVSIGDDTGAHMVELVTARGVRHEFVFGVDHYGGKPDWYCLDHESPRCQEGLTFRERALIAGAE